MTDLNAVIRDNLRAEQEARGLTDHAMGVLVAASTGWHPSQYRTHMTRTAVGFTATTIARYADALGLEPAVLVTPGGVDRQVERAA